MVYPQINTNTTNRHKTLVSPFGISIIITKFLLHLPQDKDNCPSSKKDMEFYDENEYLVG